MPAKQSQVYFKWLATLNIMLPFVYQAGILKDVGDPITAHGILLKTVFEIQREYDLNFRTKDTEYERTFR